MKAVAILLFLHLTGIAQVSLVALRLVADIFRSVIDVVLSLSVAGGSDALVRFLVRHDDLWPIEVLCEGPRTEQIVV